MHRLQFSWPILIFWKCDLPIPIFSDFISKNYHWPHIQTKIYANFNAKNIYIKKLLNITIPPIWTKLQMFSHLNNSQNKVLCDWKEEEIVNLKWVAVWNKTDHHFSPNLIKCVMSHQILTLFQLIQLA